jgi:hypothetical protein
MSTLTEIDRPPIEPVYSQIRPNQPIELSDLQVRFTCEDRTYEEVVKVVMDFLPEDHLWFFIPRHDVEFALSVFGHTEGIEFALPERAASLKVLYHGTNVGKDVSEAFISQKSVATGIGVDAGIILAQTALERLAWAHCVEDRKVVSQEAFKPRGLSAADRLRMLTSTLGIPVEIPKTMKALCGRRGTKWADIPDAITAIRNALVHPYEEKSPPTGAYYDGWRLSMWLLDLVLLCLCNHNGEYGNRIADPRYAGLVERVPWAK